MKFDKLQEEIEIPPKVHVSVSGHMITVKGEKKQVHKKITNPNVKIAVQGNMLQVYAENATKREKTLIGTYTAHLKNMFKGVTTGHKYVLKICASHFPMNVSVSNNQIVIKNFIGEKVPRSVSIHPETTVKVSDTQITVEGHDKEIVAQMAASIEQATRRSDFDRRKFMDGIYITMRDDKAA